MRSILWAAFLLILMPAGCASAAEPPRVVASLPPLQGLAAAVLDGIAAPEVLVRAGGSEHAYAVRPSDARMISGADLVLWVGPGLETFLEKPIQTLARPGAEFALSKVPGLSLLPRRTGAAWGGAHEEGEGAAGSTDLHLWLDPQNALVILAALAERLSAIDPARAGLYRANAQGAARRIRSLDAELAAQLAPLRGVPFLVFHDAYRYFERRYGLMAVGAVAIHPEHPPGARHIADLRRSIAESGARCIFAEPQFKPDLVDTLREGTGLAGGVLDPLGADLPPGAGHYEALMRMLAANLRHCLSE